MGQIFGYLSGPGKEHVDAVKENSCFQAITSLMSDTRGDVFESLRQHVMEDYTARMGQIEYLSRQAQQGEADYRNMELAALTDDRDQARKEQGQLEERRFADRVLAANQHNVIAATTEAGTCRIRFSRREPSIETSKKSAPSIVSIRTPCSGMRTLRAGSSIPTTHRCSLTMSLTATKTSTNSEKTPGTTSRIEDLGRDTLRTSTAGQRSTTTTSSSRRSG